MSIGLSIAFTGLCALIGDGDGKPGEILLLDAKGIGQVGGVTLPDHAPTLVVSLNDLANPDSSRPTRVVAGTPGQSGRVEQLGLWDLTGSEVRIRAQGGGGPGLQFFRPSKDETSWPKPPRNALHFGAYYTLLLNTPADKPLPELWQPRHDEKGAGFVRPAYCTPALFSRQ